MTLDYGPLKRYDAENPTASFIFLHGFGDDAEGFVNIAEQFRAANKLPHMNWVFPTAPRSQESLSNAWFEPQSYSGIPIGRSTNDASNGPPLEDDEDEDQVGMLRSVEYTCSLIQAEVDAGIPLKRIVIGGFSQGCFITLLTGMGSRFGGRIAGVVGLSGALGVGSRIRKEMQGYVRNESAEGKNDAMRVFLAHGQKDMLVPARLYRQTLERVEGIVGQDCVEGHLYEGMGHNTTGKELFDMCAFLERIVPEQVS